MVLSACASVAGTWDVEWLPVSNARDVCDGAESCVIRTASTCRMVTDAKAVRYDTLGGLLMRCAEGGR